MIATSRTLSLSVLAATVSACASLSPGAHPVEYSAFGEATEIERHKAETMAKLETLRESDAPPSSSVMVLVDTVPAGIEIKDGAISVQEGAPYELIGKSC